jgi:hypothetical protein
LGLIAAGRRDGVREATVIPVAIVGVDADILQEGNLAAGNSLQNDANLLKPALLIPPLILSRRSNTAGTGTVSFDRWRMTVIGSAGIVTAVVGYQLLARTPRADDANRSCPSGGHRRASARIPKDF